MQLTHKFTSLKLSSDRHEWDFASGVGNKSKGIIHSYCPVSSVLKCSKCLRLLPSILQYIFSKLGDWVRARLTALSFSKGWALQIHNVKLLAYRHWMARCGVNYRCCSLLGRGKGRVLIPGKRHTSSGLKRKLSSNILELYTLILQGQDLTNKHYSLRIIPPWSIKLSVHVCTFPFGLKVKWIIRKRHLHHYAKQENRLQSSEALSLYQGLDTV